VIWNVFLIIDVFDFGDGDEDFDGIVPTSQGSQFQSGSQGTCFGSYREIGTKSFGSEGELIICIVF
jgi:hypothetical protein